MADMGLIRPFGVMAAPAGIRRDTGLDTKNFC